MRNLKKLTETGVTPVSETGLAGGKFEFDQRALGVVAVDGKAASDQFELFFEGDVALGTGVLVFVLFHQLLDVDGATVVMHEDLNRVAADIELDLHLAGAAVIARVADHVLNGTEDHHLFVLFFFEPPLLAGLERRVRALDAGPAQAGRKSH